MKHRTSIIVVGILCLLLAAGGGTWYFLTRDTFDSLYEELWKNGAPKPGTHRKKLNALRQRIDSDLRQDPFTFAKRSHVYYAIGLNAYCDQDYELAIKEFTLGAESDIQTGFLPSRIANLDMLACSYLQSGALEKAAHYADQVIALVTEFQHDKRFSEFAPSVAGHYSAAIQIKTLILNNHKEWETALTMIEQAFHTLNSYPQDDLAVRKVQNQLRYYQAVLFVKQNKISKAQQLFIQVHDAARELKQEEYQKASAEKLAEITNSTTSQASPAVK